MEKWLIPPLPQRICKMTMKAFNARKREFARRLKVCNNTGVKLKELPVAKSETIEQQNNYSIGI